MAEVLNYRGPGEPSGRMAKAALVLGWISLSMLLVGSALGLILMAYARGYDGIAYLLLGMANAGVSALLAMIGMALAVASPMVSTLRSRVLTARWLNGIVLGITLPGAMVLVGLCGFS
jgi:hypothetical protein